MAQNKPKVFIGSSREAIEYVNAVHELLSFHAEVTPWSAGTFQAMEYTMESLEKQLNENDFAIFIFTPDDITNLRGKQYFVTRDNTLFEMGLFWGKLGRERVFCIIPNTVPKNIDDEPIEGFHIPTDLEGITVLKYEVRSDGNIQAAVNVACNKIIHSIKEQKFFLDPVNELQQAVLKMDKDYALIRFLRKLARGILSDHEKKYEYLSEGLWSSFSTPLSYNVEGIGIYKAEGADGLRQIAGNEGRGTFYPFNINEGRKEEEKIVVVECFLKNEEQVLLKNQYIDHKYFFCYPIEKQLVITIAITGRKKLSDHDIDQIFLNNHELIKTVHYLFGGTMNE